MQAQRKEVENVVSLAERYFASPAFESFVKESVAFIEEGDRYLQDPEKKLRESRKLGTGLAGTYIRESTRLASRLSSASIWLVLLQMRAHGERTNDAFAAEFALRIGRRNVWMTVRDDPRLFELPTEFVSLVQRSQQLIADLQRLSTQFDLHV